MADQNHRNSSKSATGSIMGLSRKPSRSHVGLPHILRRVLLSEIYLLPGMRTATLDTRTSQGHYLRAGLAEMQYLTVPEVQAFGVHLGAMTISLSIASPQRGIGVSLFRIQLPPRQGGVCDIPLQVYPCSEGTFPDSSSPDSEVGYARMEFHYTSMLCNISSLLEL